VSLSEYSELTPRDLLMIIDEYNEKLDREADNSLILAYSIASLQRAKKLPELSQLLDQQRQQRKTRRQTQTPEQMFAMVKRLQAQHERKEEIDHGRS
jgi:hypothetical protein